MGTRAFKIPMGWGPSRTEESWPFGETVGALGHPSLDMFPGRGRKLLRPWAGREAVSDFHREGSGGELPGEWSQIPLRSAVSILEQRLMGSDPG